jgi:N-acetylmuramoyl-L-alanine amidase
MKVNNVIFDPVEGKTIVDRVLMVRKLVIWPSRKELAFRIGSKSVWNNSSCGKLATEPFIEKGSGSTMVPWRYISEELGFTVGYDPKTKKITAQKNGTSIVMTVGQKSATVNGKQTQMTAPPTVVSGTTFVPLRFVGDSIGAKVGWLSGSKTATVFFPQ